MSVKKPKAIVIYSGGLDSTCLLYKIHKDREVIALIFNYGQRHSIEIDNAINNCKKLEIPYKVLDISFFKDIASSSALLDYNKEIPNIRDIAGHAQPPTYVPNRNMMFLSIATAAAESAGADKVYYGAAEVDTHSGHWDCSLDFLKYINETISLNREHQIKIEAPYITYSKADIIKDGISNNVDFNNTHTCYKGEEIACGTCTACSSRIQGFLEAGYIDPKQYVISDKIPWKDHNCQIV
jgi:7-cyano-7-deazaguanine synthase